MKPTTIVPILLMLMTVGCNDKGTSKSAPVSHFQSPAAPPVAEKKEITLYSMISDQILDTKLLANILTSRLLLNTSLIIESRGNETIISGTHKYARININLTNLDGEVFVNGFYGSIELNLNIKVEDENTSIAGFFGLREIKVSIDNNGDECTISGYHGRNNLNLNLNHKGTDISLAGFKGKANVEENFFDSKVAIIETIRLIVPSI